MSPGRDRGFNIDYEQQRRRNSGMDRRVVLYGTPACPMIPAVRARLERAGASFDYVDILRDHQVRERVRQINRGYESVPTLVFPDGSTLTEPSAQQLTAKLRDQGYEVSSSPLPGGIRRAMGHPVALSLGAVVLLVALASGTVWLAAIGLTMLAMAVLARAFAGRR